MATDKARFTISVDDEMFREIEDFHFDNRFQTRSSTVTVLVRLGLLKAKELKATRPELFPDGIKLIR